MKLKEWRVQSGCSEGCPAAGTSGRRGGLGLLAMTQILLFPPRHLGAIALGQHGQAALAALCGGHGWAV